MSQSEEYLVTVDGSEDGEYTLIVCRMNSRNIKLVKRLSGEEARKVYKVLTEKE